MAAFTESGRSSTWKMGNLTGWFRPEAVIEGLSQPPTKRGRTIGWRFQMVDATPSLNFCAGGSQEWSDIPFACATKTRLNTTIVCHFLMSQVAQNSARLRQHNHRVLPRQIPDGRSFYAKPWGVGKSVVKSLRIYLKSAPLWMGTNYATEELR